MIVSFITLGCKQNKYESDCMANILKINGYEIRSGLEYADIYVINTCAVTQEAEKKSRQYISKVNKINPNSKIIVCGCASQNNIEQFLDKENVYSVIGNEGKEKILDIILYSIKEVFEINHTEYPNLYAPLKTTTRAHLKIQDGCNNFCNYCLIPYLRGRSRSRDLEDIVFEAKELSKHSREIVLTGIDISSYKYLGKPALPLLLLRLSEVPSTIRLGSLEVNVITRELLDVMIKMPNFAPHFHLSLQSGEDSVLKSMNRHYTTSEYLEKVSLIREYFPLANITTDVIVGYYSETEESFETTKRFVDECKFSFMHIFPYSKREGTVAYRYSDLPKEVKAGRVDELEAINKVNHAEYLSKFRGTYSEVLIEEIKDKYMVGYTREYVRVYVKIDESKEIGYYHRVKILKLLKDGVLAKFI